MANTAKGKRKTTSEEVSEPVKASKKSRQSAKGGEEKSGSEDAGGSGLELAKNGQPTNKVLPAKITFATKAEGSTRIVTWNVAGLAAARKKVRSC